MFYGYPLTFKQTQATQREQCERVGPTGSGGAPWRAGGATEAATSAVRAPQEGGQLARLGLH